MNTPPEAAPNLVEGLPKVHQALVEAGIRDQIALVASGGLAMAEHCPKSFILGADAVVDRLAAGDCARVPRGRNCVAGECALRLEALDPRLGRQRIVNLMGAWRLQILEVLWRDGVARNPPPAR